MSRPDPTGPDGPRRFFSREAVQALQRLPGLEQRRVRDVLPLLGADGRNTKRLHGGGRYLQRRLGDLRVIWRPTGDDGSLAVVRIARRREDTHQRLPDDLRATFDESAE